VEAVAFQPLELVGLVEEELETVEPELLTLAEAVEAVLTLLLVELVALV
jgi:hypothetical protein